MNCDYCFYRDEMEKDGGFCGSFMTEETLKNVIRKTILKSGTGISFAFQGGEPTLRGIDFFEKAVFYEKKYNRNQVPVSNSIQTNGLLLDGDWCDFLKRNQFLTGISLDGTALTHDAYRHDGNGKGTYDRVLKAACLLERREISFNILTVVTEKLAENISSVYELYKLNHRFPEFLKENMDRNPLKCEFFLPTVVSELIREGKAVVDVMKSRDRWYGVTYHEDKEVVMNAVKQFKKEGIYPEKLWE